MTPDGALPPGSTIGVLGGGQLGRMIALAAARLGIKTHIYAHHADEPAAHVAAAVTTAMLGSDPEVKRVRDRIGAVTRDRLVDALGPDGDEGTVMVLALTFSGAMLQAGMGHLAYADLPAVVADATRRVLGEAP